MVWFYKLFLQVVLFSTYVRSFLLFIKKINVLVLFLFLVFEIEIIENPFIMRKVLF